LIPIKAPVASAPIFFPSQSGRKSMTFYLAGVIAAFAIFGGVLFVVSTWTALKK
jgi:hypothetical protein